MTLDLEIAPELASSVSLGLLLLEGVTVRDAGAALQGEVEACCLELKTKYGSGRSAEVPGANDARVLYKALGLDPTKTRPSNEALLRRALKGEPLHRISTLVDALNLASLRFQLPFGLYDVAHLRPPLVLRKGAPGERYEGIRKGVVGVEGRPVLADRLGPFGNPSSDSARTMITPATRDALVVVYAPASYPAWRLEQVLEGAAAILLRHAGGREAARRRLPG